MYLLNNNNDISNMNISFNIIPFRFWIKKRNWNRFENNRSAHQIGDVQFRLFFNHWWWMSCIFKENIFWENCWKKKWLFLEQEKVFLWFSCHTHMFAVVLRKYIIECNNSLISYTHYTAIRHLYYHGNENAAFQMYAFSSN